MKYKIVDHTWHIYHQSDQYYALRNDVEVDFVLNSWRQWQDIRFKSARPIPGNIDFVAHYEPGKYDVAILHIDQQAIDERIQKGRIYRQFDKTIQDIPKIVVNHGTPVFHEYTQKAGMTPEQADQTAREYFKKLLGDNTMVVNSHDATSDKEWGWGVPIVHGMNPDDWWDLKKEPRIFSSLSPKGIDSYYNRDVMRDVVNKLNEDYARIIMWAKVNCLFDGWDEYRDYLGRSLIYLDVSTRTPMNRARTEAMLSGCCVVQVEGAHDLDRWAKDGENIIIVPNDVNAIVEKLNDLVENHYDRCVEIGQAGKEMAMKEFSVQRYRDDWVNLLEKITNK